MSALDAAGLGSDLFAFGGFMVEALVLDRDLTWHMRLGQALKHDGLTSRSISDRRVSVRRTIIGRD